MTTRSRGAHRPDVRLSDEVLLAQLVGPALHADPPDLQQVRAVDQLEHLTHVLLDDQDRVALLADAADQVEEPEHHDGGQAHRGLVEEDQPGPRHEGPADGQHLLLAAGEAAGPLAAPLGQDREEREHAVHALGEVPARRGQEGAHLEVVGHRQGRERCRRPSGTWAMPWATISWAGRPPRRGAFEHELARCAGGITPEITRSSVVLPAPFGPDHGHRLAGLDPQADVPQGGEVRRTPPSRPLELEARGARGRLSQLSDDLLAEVGLDDRRVLGDLARARPRRSSRRDRAPRPGRPPASASP